MKNKHQKDIGIHQGNILITVLVFTGVFLTLTTSLLSRVNLEVKVSRQSVAERQALAIAEAGVEYYRWRLSHFPDDVTDGTGIPGPYTRAVTDPMSGAHGTVELDISSQDLCSGTTTITARGWPNDNPSVVRSARITFGAPAITQFSYLTNANIWFGGDDAIAGPVHGNNGIRMDSPNTHRVTSAKETYICGQEHGCSPPQEKPAVWGTGSGGSQGLWDFPTSRIDFEAVTLDLDTLESAAAAAGTSYGTSGGFGYHVRLRPPGFVDVYSVTQIKPKVWGYDGRTGWLEQAEGIQAETLITTHTIPEPSACNASNLFFFADTLFVDGTTERPVTLIAARLPDTDATNVSVIINGNLVVQTAQSGKKEGSIGIVAQKDVLIPLESPNVLTLDAALFAQKGHVFRNFYCSNEFYNRYGWKCRSSYASNTIRDTVNLHGTIVTNQIAAWTWVNGSGAVTSGYRGGSSTFDTRLTDAPPPFFPKHGAARIVTWDEPE